jgi:dipeptidyl aminopeptidase/acylaminoacyl peptidase
MPIPSHSQPCKRALTRAVLALATLATAACFNTANATYPGENGVIVFDDGAGAIRRVSPGNGTVTTLPNGAHPVVSPNGKKIAFDRPDYGAGFGDIYVMNIDGSNIIKLTDSAARTYYTWPTWSPDGSKLGYTVYTVSTTQSAFWTMNPDGTGKTWKRDLSTSQIDSFSWSPSGNTYAFSLSDIPAIMVFDDLSSRPIRRADGGYLSWAPNGASLLFNNSSNIQSEVNWDGSGLHVVPGNNQVWFSRSAISPDGTAIAGAISAAPSELATRDRATGAKIFSWVVGRTRNTDWARVPKNCYESTPAGGGGVLANDVDFYAEQCAIAVMPDGGAMTGILQQAIAVGPDGRLYDRLLKSDPFGGTPTWTRFAVVPGVAGNPNGVDAKKIAIAAAKDGSSQVVIINASDNAVYHAMRQANGTWSGFTALGGFSGAPNFQARDVAIAINASTYSSAGNAQVIANGLAVGSVFHRVRWAAGNWTPFAQVPGAAGMNTRELAIAASEDGNTNVLATTTAADGSQSRIMQALRGADSNWSNWVTVGVPKGTTLSATTDVAVTRTLDGRAQMMFTDSSGNAVLQERSTPNLPSSWQSEAPGVPVATAVGRAVSIAAGAAITSSSQLLVTRTFPQ